MEDQLERRVLFIGGPADGRWLLVPDHMVRWRATIPTEMETLPAESQEYPTPIQVVEYVREPLGYGSLKRYSVFVATTCTKNVIELLIDGYKHR